jgi:hypothetical protein
MHGHAALAETSGIENKKARLRSGLGVGQRGGWTAGQAMVTAIKASKNINTAPTRGNTMGMA